MKEEMQAQSVDNGVSKPTRINRMVMHGFKSFAKLTELPLSDGFNVVLGPNGSGKSNVMDALCFVLGKSSSKSLRAEKSSNLIYNGGKSKKPAKQGEVSIFFDNSKSTFPVDEKEVKISRIVRQNGQSIYKINDRPMTRQQVLDLLSHGRINPDGFNIILQGDIVRFVEMPPIERRELIEEVSGISVYEEKKRKAISELEKVEERLKETEIVLTERNTYLKELKKDRDQALKYKDMNDRIRESKASYLRIQIDAKEKENREMQEKLDKTSEELKKINEKISKLKEDSSRKRDEIKKITQDIEEKGEVEQVRLNKEIESLKIDLTRSTSRIDALKGELSKLEQRKKDLKDSISEVDSKMKELAKEKESIQKKINDRIKERKLMADRIAGFRQKHNLEGANDIDKKVEEIDKKSEELQKEIQSLRERQHEFIRRKDAIRHELNAIESQMSKVAEVEKEHKSQIDALKKKREDFKKHTLELNKKLDEDSSLSSQLGNARQKLHVAGEEIAKLNARQMSIREVMHTDTAIKKILEERKKNRKIYGTVAELGNVASKYSLALEIAAGPRIKNIVVEDDKTASDLIKYLKQNRLGTATFLPLNKIKGRDSKIQEDFSKANGCHGLAIDLISYDSKFKNVFSYVFGDAFVVDNIDVARRLGIGKAKFVTLDGDLAEFSGAMHGGFRDKKRQGMGFKESDLNKDIEKYDGMAAELQGTIDILEKRRKENEAAIQELRQLKAGLEGEIIKTEKSLHLEDSDLGASKDKKAELGKQDKKLDEGAMELNGALSKKNAELMQLKVEKQKLRSQISQLRNPTLIAELNTFEQKMQEFSEEIITLNSEMKSMDTQMTEIYSSEIEKTQKILKQHEKDAELFQKELRELNLKVKEKEKILNEREKAAQEFYAKFKSLFAERGKIESDIQKNEVDMGKHIDSSRQVEIRNNTLSLKIAEIKAILSGLQQEFSQYEGVKLDLEKSEEQLKNEIRKFEKMKEEIGSVNMRALEIYEEVEKQYNILMEKKDKLVKEKEDVVQMMEEIEAKKKDLFLKNFDIVNTKFKHNFSQLSTKGDAYLVLEDPENIFEAGVRINVKITGSKFMDIRSLSGGEKTMTALAFIFAIQEYQPASFYVLDEVDAALDKHNSEKLAKLVRSYCTTAQYLVISHNDSLISEADTLYGTSMNEHGITQILSLKV